MAFKMAGFSAFTKDTKYKGSKHDTGGFVEGQRTDVGDGPTDEQIASVKNALNDPNSKYYGDNIVSHPVVQEFNMYVSPEGEIEVDAKTMKK